MMDMEEQGKAEARIPLSVLEPRPHLRSAGFMEQVEML
jgi:hypothetical protein